MNLYEAVSVADAALDTILDYSETNAKKLLDADEEARKVVGAIFEDINSIGIVFDLVSASNRDRKNYFNQLLMLSAYFSSKCKAKVPINVSEYRSKIMECRVNLLRWGIDSYCNFIGFAIKEISSGKYITVKTKVGRLELGSENDAIVLPREKACIRFLKKFDVDPSNYELVQIKLNNDLDYRRKQMEHMAYSWEKGNACGWCEEDTGISSLVY